MKYNFHILYDKQNLNNTKFNFKLNPNVEFSIINILIIKKKRFNIQIYYL